MTALDRIKQVVNNLDKFQVEAVNTFKTIFDNSDSVDTELETLTTSIEEVDAKINNSKGYVTDNNFGILHLKSKSASVLLENTDVITLEIPAGVKIFAVQVINSSTIVNSGGGATYTVEFTGGNSDEIFAGIEYTRNAKSSVFFEEVAAGSMITSDVTDARVIPDTGTFTDGEVTLLVWYYELTNINDFVI